MIDKEKIADAFLKATAHFAEDLAADEYEGLVVKLDDVMPQASPAAQPSAKDGVRVRAENGLREAIASHDHEWIKNAEYELEDAGGNPFDIHNEATTATGLVDGVSQIVGARRIDGVHVIVAKPASELLPEQLLVRYDELLKYKGLLTRLRPLLTSINEDEGDSVNLSLQALEQIEAAIGREVGK